MNLKVLNVGLFPQNLQGYAAREFVKLGVHPGELAIFSKEAVCAVGAVCSIICALAILKMGLHVEIDSDIGVQLSFEHFLDILLRGPLFFLSMVEF